MVKIDVMLANSVVDAARRASELERTGVDGVFSFENAHDLFFPGCRRACLLARPDDKRCDRFSAQSSAPGPCRVRPSPPLRRALPSRPRVPDPSACRAALRSVLGQTGPTDAGVGARHQGHLAELARRRRLDFRGEYTSHTLMTPAFNPGPNPFGLPKVLVGALGPRMNQMAAEVADGILVMPFNSERHMRERTRPAIDAGLSAAGRRRTDIELTAEVIVGVGRTDRELEAARGVRNLLAFYGSTPAYRQFSMSRVGENCSPSSTHCRSAGNGEKCHSSSTTRCSEPWPSTGRLPSARRRSHGASQTAIESAPTSPSLPSRTT